ncbi:MAG: ABC transporter permease [Gammaproteobacteria bacterium]
MSFSDAFIDTLRDTLRDRAAVVTIIVAVLIYGFYYPEAYRHQEVDRLPLVVIDHDDSVSSRELLRKVDSLRGVQTVARLAAMPAAEHWITSRRADAILLILPGFERDILRGDRGRVAVYGNGANLLRASNALASLAEALASFGAAATREQAQFLGAPAGPAFELVQRPLYNTRVGYGSTVVPAVGQLIAQQTLLIGMVLVLAWRRERLGCRPRMTGRALLGTGAFFALLGIFSSAHFAGFVPWFHDYPRGGNLAVLALAIPVFMLAVTAFGLFIASFFRVRERAMLFLLPSALPMYFVSGVSWQAEAIPTAARGLAALLPSTHGIPLIMKLNQMGASLEEVAPEFAALVMLTLFYSALAWWRYRPRHAPTGTPINPAIAA